MHDQLLKPPHLELNPGEKPVIDQVVYTLSKSICQGSAEPFFFRRFKFKNLQRRREIDWRIRNWIRYLNILVSYIAKRLVFNVYCLQL